MKLYEYGFARSARCHWVLAEAGAEYQSITIDLVKGEHKTPEFLAINPYGKIPVLIDEEASITESVAICTYVAEKFPDKELIPQAGTVERAHYYQWMSFCISELEPALWVIRKHTSIYPKEKRSLNVIKLAKEEYLAAAQILDDRLVSSPFVLGDRFGGIDVIIGYNLVWADMYKLLKNFAHLSSYLDKLQQRPAFPHYAFQEHK